MLVLLTKAESIVSLSWYAEGFVVFTMGFYTKKMNCEGFFLLDAGLLEEKLVNIS